MADGPANSGLDDSYLTISQRSEEILKERGSKFIGIAQPVRSEAEIQTILTAIRKEYFDATHHCYAWVLGKDGKHFRANDDGEPNHSAGDPILGQIRSQQLSDILIVVVRYYGGTKLGVSGLIQAYRGAAALALSTNQVIEKRIEKELNIHFPYPSLNKVMKVIKTHQLEILDQQMELNCSMKLRFRAGLEPIVIASLGEIEGMEWISE